MPTEEARVSIKLSALTRWANVFLWFSATSFFHGYALLVLLYYVITSTLDATGAVVVTHPDHPSFKLQVPKGRALFLVLVLIYVAGIALGRREHNLKSYWRAFTRSSVTRAALEYFEAGTVGAEALDAIKGERCLIGLHPHGIYPIAGILAYAGASPLLERQPWLRVRPCGASILFKIPLIREYLIWTGHLDAGRRTMAKHMSKGVDDLGLVVGGEQEALLTRNGEETVVLEGRAGFVSLALKYGYHLVPTYAFGQNELYTVNQSLLASFRAALQRRFKVSIPIFWGVCGTPMPHPVRLTLAIGNPIKVPSPPSPGAEPDPELVTQIHAQYMAELKALFERHKAAAGYPDRTLTVVAAAGGKAAKAARGKAKHI